MNLLHSLLIFGLLLFIVCKPFEQVKASEAADGATAEYKLLEFVNNEQTSISKDFCEKAIKLSEKLLKDEVINQARSLIIQDFKKNITDFVRKYPSYIRFNLYKKLELIFTNLTITTFRNDLNTHNDSLYILNVMKKDFNDLSINYENKIKDLIVHKLPPKLEQFKTQHSILEWYNEIKKCQEYECFDRFLIKLHKIINSPKKELYDFIRLSLIEKCIFYGDTATEMAQQILNDKNVTHLKNATLRIEFTKDLNDFINKYKTERNAYQLHPLIQWYYDNILMKYYYYLEGDDGQAIKNLFKAHGEDQFEIDLQTKFNDFVEQDFYKRFDEFKAQLNKEELAKEKVLLDWYDQLKSCTDYKERVAAFKLLGFINIGREV